MRWVPAYFNAPIYPAEFETQLRQKVIPLSHSPFDPSQENVDFDEVTVTSPEEEEEETRVEAVPEWLELFFDLAWTITFSGLSANTPIKGPMTVVSYLLFFALTWWLWIAQVLYDTKFYVNDWWHRIFLLLQFILFGTLSAFTDGFDVTIGIKADDPSDSDAGDAAEETYVKRAFLAISMVFFVSRLLLAIEYFRVTRYAKQRRLAHLYILIGTLCASATLFLISFLVTRAHPDSKGANALKFVLWILAIGIEVVAYFYTSMPRGLLRTGSMPERLSTLTTVVIGEGLNGLIDPIVSAAKSVGFNASVAAQVFAVGLLVFLIFILYFQSFRARLAPTPLRQKMIIMVHFATQLFIILLLEGMKSLLNITTLLNSLNFFINTVFPSLASFDHPPEDLLSAYQQIGLSLPELSQKLSNKTGHLPPELLSSLIAEVPDLTEERFKRIEFTFRAFAAALQALGNTFKVLDDKQNSKFSSYISDDNLNGFAVNDTVWAMQHLNTTAIFPPFLEDIAGATAAEKFAPATWVSAVAGFFLLSLALLMTFNGLHKNCFEWYSLLSRIIGGVAVALLAFVDFNPTDLIIWVGTGWFLPTIVICYFILYVVDYVIAVVAARVLHREEQQALYKPTLNTSETGYVMEISARTPAGRAHDKYE
ncbi:hypothetical protein EXIGLDRAFT_834721 [Exidia glandulosa HHB12029]|uniref:Low temperature requirement A n=1 Tax=Exidia glandulosa HHB12029 TaxID=1314781 RepID=A0A165JIM2_EXIGL|nr:hypothetical protein EXIGLDRAFT_834721 [Exidia glandulosa HHB12029]